MARLFIACIKTHLSSVRFALKYVDNYISVSLAFFQSWSFVSKAPRKHYSEKRPPQLPQVGPQLPLRCRGAKPLPLCWGPSCLQATCLVEERRSTQGTGETMGPPVPGPLARKATLPGEGNVLESPPGPRPPRVRVYFSRWSPHQVHSGAARWPLRLRTMTHCGPVTDKRETWPSCQAEATVPQY